MLINVSWPLVLIHYDLDSTSGSRDYTVLSPEKFRTGKVQRLSQSVLGLTLQVGQEPWRVALTLWEELVELTKGTLKPGDVFYIHYGDGAKIGTIGEKIEKGTSLTGNMEVHLLSQMWR